MKYLAMTMVVVACIGLSREAHAQAKRITLLGVSGPGGAKLQKHLELVLSEEYEVVPGEVYRSTAAQLHKPGASPEEVQAVASELKLDAVIGASIVNSDGERMLLIAVRDGNTGRVVAKGRYELAGGTKAIRERLVSDLVKALDHTAPTGVSKSEDEAAPITDSAKLVKRAPGAERPVAGFTAAIGPTVMSRSLTFSGGDNIFYRSGTVAGLRVDATLFPFALSSRFASDHPVLASFGLIGQFEHFFSFAYPVDGGGSTNGGGQRYEILAAGRIPLGHHAVGGYLQLETGFQHLDFGHDDEMAAGVPNVSYDTVDLGFQWERSLGVRWLRLAVRFAYLAPVGAGDIVTANQFGHASAWGIDADAGLTFVPLKWLWFRLEGRISAVGLKFAGTGALVANSSVDDYPGGALQAGFAL